MANQTKHVKLNLTQNSADLVRRIQGECRTWRYDIQKVMSVLNCPYYQAHTLIQLAQIEDAKPAAVSTPATKAATKAA